MTSRSAVRETREFRGLVAHSKAVLQRCFASVEAYLSYSRSRGRDAERESAPIYFLCLSATPVPAYTLWHGYVASHAKRRFECRN